MSTMPNTEMLQRFSDAADRAAARADDVSGWFHSARETILQMFGPNGLIAAYILAGVIAILLLTKIAKLTFSTVKFVVVPALILTFIATTFFDISFEAAAPASATVCSLFLLFKG